MQESDFLTLLIQISKASPTFTLVTFICLLSFLVMVLIILRNSSRQKRIEKKLLNYQLQNQKLSNVNTSPPMHSSVLNMDIKDLLDIEDALLALRELYHRKLINSEVYVDQSMKHSERIRA
jgi:hypothetical protein